MAEEKKPRRPDADLALLYKLATGATVAEAARSVGLSTRSVNRRLADPAFAERLEQLRARLGVAAMEELLDASAASVRTLVTLQADDQPGAVRLGAAKAVLELGMKARERSETERRLRALEESLSPSPEAPPGPDDVPEGEEDDDADFA